MTFRNSSQLYNKKKVKGKQTQKSKKKEKKEMKLRNIPSQFVAVIWEGTPQHTGDKANIYTRQ